MDIQWIAAPKKLLYIFRHYRDLHNWLESNTDNLYRLGASIAITTNIITFPNGNVLYLGHAENEEDLAKFYGLEYDIIGGYYNEFLKYRELTSRRF